MRKVAQAAGAGYIKPDDFEKFWPGPARSSKELPSWKATSIEFRQKLMEQYKKDK